MGEPTGRLVSRLLCRLSSAVLVSSAFEVDTDSWMLEEPCAPLAEEKAQRNINGMRLDMVMQANTYCKYTLAELQGWRATEGKKKQKKKLPNRGE